MVLLMEILSKFSTVSGSEAVKIGREFISSNPGVTSVVVAVSVFFTIAVMYKVVKYSRSESDYLVSSLSDADTVTIVMHENPDPDTMASAMGLSKLAESVDTEAEIVYPGRISHDENRAFRAVLDVNFKKIETVDQISGDKVALVDQSTPRGIKNGDTLIPDIIIDHHSTSEADESLVEFVHIRQDVGACSTIITKFLRDQGLIDQNAENTKLGKDVCTGLYHGIKSDTDNISSNISSDDIEAVSILYKNIDEDKLYRISNPKVNEDSLEAKARAIMGRDVRGSFSVSDIGDVKYGDSIPQAADELVNLEGVSATAVLATCDGNLRISARSYDDRIHMGDTLIRALEDIEGASAGGHAKMAGGSIPTDEINNGSISRSELVERIFNSMEGR